MASLSLAFDILAKDKGASKTFDQVGDAAEKAGKKGEGFGSAITRGIGVAAGAIAAAGLGRAFAGFVSDAAESAKISRLTGAVLKSTGGIANVTADQVNDLATSISNKTAVDDEAIQSGANMLLTFTKVRNETGKGNKIFDQAAQAAVDMSVALGTDVTSASLQLGKALNDPIKGVTALSKAGVSFTQQQKDQIKEMVKAGDVLGAQKIILGEMATQFGGAAEAAADPIERLKVVAGNLGEEVGGFLLPHIEKFATFIADKAIPNLGLLHDAFVSGWSSDTSSFDGFLGFVSRVGDVTGAISYWVKDVAIPALQDFAGYIRDEVIPRLQDFGGYIRDEIGPRLADLRSWFEDDLKPALKATRDYLVEKFTPTWEALKDAYNNDIKPAVDDLRVAFERNKPEIMEIVRMVGLLIGALALFQVALSSTILPLLVQFAGLLAGEVLRELGQLLDTIGFLTDKFKEAWEWFGKFSDRISQFKVPGWISGMGGAIGNIAGALTGAAGAAAAAGVGDGPGRFAGGNTLAKVKGLLPAGAQITSTYRTPAQNAAVGGVTGSYHTDRGNPAVDIAGSRSVMDAVYQRLAAVGGWRELLYKTKGHWDHVHVAHQGGTVSANWPKMPGWGANERPVRAEVGETIVPAGGGSGRQAIYNNTINNYGRDLTQQDLYVAQRQAEMMAPAW